jgi:hypothetical protein
VTGIVASWTCPRCAAARTTAFCGVCGEQPISPRDLSLRGLADMTYTAFSPVDGKVLRTLLKLVTQPGALTRAFYNGLRKPYLGPFQVFLIANVLFFALQSFSDLRIFTRTLEARLQPDQLWSDLARSLVEQRLAATGKSFTAYAAVFDQAVAVNAKSLIGLMVPFLAGLLPLVFWRPARPLAVHFVFALHFYAFLLLLFCVPLAATGLGKSLGGPGGLSGPADDAVSVGLMMACAAYLYLAAGPVYGARGVARIFQAFVLTTGVVGIYLVYRFILLPAITLYTT